MNWHEELIDQLDFYWKNQFRPRLDGLTDEEYFWEPVSGCWSVRPQPGGGAVREYAFPPPDPPPVTTIAWRLCHIGGDCFEMRASNHFGDGSYRPDRTHWPLTAADALAYVDTQYTAWRAGIEELDDEALTQPVGETEGPHAQRTYATLILHLNRELMHHGGELGLLRDLYRAAAGRVMST
ncbi:MAG: DinB family protein [Pseudonocardiaceae bacterium]|nr:DinB family protein [Pseudonocardiaceae bacterium]